MLISIALDHPAHESAHYDVTNLSLQDIGKVTFSDIENLTLYDILQFVPAIHIPKLSQGIASHFPHRPGGLDADALFCAIAL